MFDNLSLKLDRAFKTLKGTGKITEINVASTVKEIRRALIDADVNYKVAKEVTDKIKDEAMGRDVLISVSPGQLLVKITQEELTKLMGTSKVDIKLSGDPSVILISGLQGSGKTTFAGKLGSLLKRQGRQVLLVACDIYRPAAIDQLKVLGEQIGVEVYAEPESKNALQIANNAIAYAKKTGKKTVVVDTAGRLAVDEAMMQEIELLKKSLNPSETLFVVDAMTGQDAVNERQFPFAMWSISPSSLSLREKKWKTWMFFIPTVWPKEFWEWETSSLWWSVPNSPLMKTKPAD